MSLLFQEKRWQHSSVAFPAALLLIVLMLPAQSEAVSLTTSSNQNNGTITLSYSGNIKHWVYILEVLDDDRTTQVRADRDFPQSGSITIHKTEGNYSYKLRLCDRVTLNHPSNCTYTPPVSIMISNSTTPHEVVIQYEYDALGRLIKTQENGIKKSEYEYDPAGNRKEVTY